jgi:hypothetical protein
MRVKDRVMELLRSEDTAPLERYAQSHPQAVRFLLGRLWDPDPRLRARAAAGIGAAAASHRELGRDLLRRLMWALNDEAATNGVYGLAAIGEIGARDPELVEPFVGPVASYAWDDGLRRAIIRAMSRIADEAPAVVAPVVDDIKQWVDPEDDSEIDELGDLAQKVGA